MAWRYGIAAVAAAIAIAPGAALAGDYRYNHSSWGVAGDPCAEQRAGRQVVGAVMGGVVGGLLGNAIADGNDGHYRGRGYKHRGHHYRGYRHGGYHGGGGEAAATAVGVVLGAAVGAGIAGETVDCGYRRDYRARAPGGYQSGYQEAGWSYTETPYGYVPDDGYGGWGEEWGASEEDLYGSPEGDYRYENEPAARECKSVKSITRLPDGTEIHKPVTACREARYGEWSVQD